MSRTLTTQAAEIATWTRILAFASITMGGLVGLGGIIAAASAQAFPATRRLIMAAALVYLIAAAVSIVLGVVLLRYGQRMRMVAERGQVAALVDALDYENIYWRIAGTLVVLSLSAGLISAAVPSLGAAFQRSQSRRTARDMETIGQALEDYALREHQYPSAKSIDDLARVLEPRYIAHMPRRDANDQPFAYKATCKYNVCGEYELSSSGGADGKPEYVFSNGHFTTGAVEK